MIDFSVWEMPLQYSGIIDEHMAVRQRAGAFDVSHMGDFVIRGKDASDLMDRLNTNKISNAPKGKCTYSHLLNDRGEILDDTIIASLGNDEYFMVPNAATTPKMRQWVKEHLKGQELHDNSMDLASVAVQGPVAKDVIAQLTTFDLSALRFFWGAFVRLDLVESRTHPLYSALLKDREMANGSGDGISAYVSRTGYTGEDGFEIVCENMDAVPLWDATINRGRPLGLKPVGLGARDTLRLEKGLLLSGTDFDGAQTSLQTGPSWVVDWDHDFIGKDRLVKQKSEGGYDKLVCMLCEDRGIPRHGYEIVSKEKKLGHVTSGTLSPVLRKGIAMGYVPSSEASMGNEVEIEIRDTSVRAKIVKPPFVK